MITLDESGYPWIPYWMRPRSLDDAEGTLPKVAQAVENTLKFIALIVPSIVLGGAYGLAKGVVTSVKNVLLSFRRKVSRKKSKEMREYGKDRKKDEDVRLGANPYEIDENPGEVG